MKLSVLYGMLNDEDGAAVARLYTLRTAIITGYKEISSQPCLFCYPHMATLSEAQLPMM